MDHDEFDDKDFLIDEPSEDDEKEEKDDLSSLGFHEVDADGLELESEI